MLEAAIKAQLKAYMERLVQPIELRAFLDNSENAQKMRALLDDIASVSDKITVVDAGTAAGERVPSFQVTQAGRDTGMRFAGLPLGHEFTSLVLALLQASGYPAKVEAAVIEQIRGLTGPLVFESFVSLSCHNCPDVVQALNLLAATNPAVKHVMIEGAMFQEEVTARQIMAVPQVFLNGEFFGSGRMTLEEILAKVDTGAAERDAAAISAKDAFDVLVVGAGPAGSAASIYAARKGIPTGIVAERIGGQVMDTLGIENFISVKETEGPKLAAALENHLGDYPVDVMKLQRAKKLTPATAATPLHQIELESGATLRAKTMILSTGARWKELDVPGEREYKNKGVAYCPHCDGPLFKGKRVAVVGGGNSGVEAAIDLAGIVAEVTLIEYGRELKADAVLQAKLRSLPNVKVFTQARTREITGANGKVNGLVYEDMAAGRDVTLPLEGVFVQIGLLPNTDWLAGSGVERNRFGEIIVDAHGTTSIPGVFAAGDCTTVPYKQIIIAMGEGSKAALSAFDYLIRTSAPMLQAA
ncbi:MAG: alkyl hydroperoxide reductase subunit F [Noviherbaspirillum sp.]